jgi:hypothetical protein
MANPEEKAIKLDKSDYIYDLLVLGYLKHMREHATKSIEQSAANFQELAVVVDESAGETAASIIAEAEQG